MEQVKVSSAAPAVVVESMKGAQDAREAREAKGERKRTRGKRSDDSILENDNKKKARTKEEEEEDLLIVDEINYAFARVSRHCLRSAFLVYSCMMRRDVAMCENCDKALCSEMQVLLEYFDVSIGFLGSLCDDTEHARAIGLEKEPEEGTFREIKMGKDDHVVLYDKGQYCGVIVDEERGFCMQLAKNKE